MSDVDRALQFYVDQVGFTLDVDYAPNDAFCVVQLAPPLIIGQPEFDYIEQVLRAVLTEAWTKI